MLRVIKIAITTAITSLYYFPFWFMALPTINTKQIIAVIGLCIGGVELIKKRSAKLDRGLIDLTILAISFSLICFFSIAYNGTTDIAYVTYIISMWVWLVGAYGVCRLIKSVHGCVSFKILSHYLILVCVLQCFLALFIEYNIEFKTWIDQNIVQDQEFLTRVKRLYGIGVMLDTAGIRFSIALLLLSFLITRRKTDNQKGLTFLYLVAFIVLTIVGNMIARTTSTGVILSLSYIVYCQFFRKGERPFELKELVYGVLIIICICIPTVSYLYNIDDTFQKNFRFGFEGIFNLVETGVWKVGSNEQLKSMIIFPETFKTWLIGDGYFNNPLATDPYYIGKITGGYYMGTDIGYLRFIFYCGLIGLSAFSLYICKVVSLCIERYPTKREILFLLGILNFVVWFKVSTDLFLMFALLLMADAEVPSNERPNNTH